MTEFVKKVIREDAKYFLDRGFISEDRYRRVLDWQEGANDSEIQSVIIRWLENDIRYIAEVEDSAAKQLWYMWPLVKLALWILKGQLRKAVTKWFLIVR